MSTIDTAQERQYTQRYKVSSEPRTPEEIQAITERIRAAREAKVRRPTKHDGRLLPRLPKVCHSCLVTNKRDRILYREDMIDAWYSGR